MKWWLRGALMLLLLGVGYASVLGWMYVHQNDWIFRPPPKTHHPFNTHLRMSDGVMMGLWHDRKNQPQSFSSSNSKVLVVFGGNAMSWQGRARHLMSQCTRRDVVFMPYRSFEGNPSTPNEKQLVQDGVILMRWVKRQYSDVAVLGISLGTNIATQVSRAQPPRKLLLGTPFDQLSTVARHHMFWAQPQWLLKDTFNTEHHLPHVKVPVFVLATWQDGVIPVQSTQRLKQVTPSARWTFVQGNHDTVWNTQEACRWLQDSAQ